MIKLYGVPTSRAHRNLWMLAELGLEFEHILTPFDGPDTKTEEFLGINPNGKVPALVDGDVVLWESMAINLYLADKYDRGLRPTGIDQRAQATKWSVWAMTELEAALIPCILHRLILPKEERDEHAAEAGQLAAQKPFAVLNLALEGRDYLGGNRFGVADLNVASVAAITRLAAVDVSTHGNLDGWLERTLSRQAAKQSLGV